MPKPDADVTPETRARRKNRRGLRLQHRCTRCTRDKGASTTSFCAACRRADSCRQRAERQEWLALDLCGRCGGDRGDSPTLTCPACRASNQRRGREGMRRLRRRAREAKQAAARARWQRT